MSSVPPSRDRITRRTRTASSVSPPGMAHTQSPSRRRSQSRLRSCRTSAASKRLSTMTTGARTSPSASTVSRTALIVPSPASATSTTRSGSSTPHSKRQSPSAASGERTPPAVSTRPTSTWSCGHRSSCTRSATANGGRPRASAAIGGAIGTSYQRCGGHTTPGGSPLAAPRTCASRSAGSSAGSKDCAGLRAATVTPAARRSVRRRAATHVLPTAVPVPTTATRRRGRVPGVDSLDGATALRARPAPGEAGGPALRATASRRRPNAPPTASPAAGSCRPARSAGGWRAPTTPGPTATPRP